MIAILEQQQYCNPKYEHIVFVLMEYLHIFNDYISSIHMNVF